MKKISVFICLLLLAFSVSASSRIAEPSADNLIIPLFNTGKTISLAKFMKLKPSEYKEITGKKMSWQERIALKIFQHHFKNSINKNGTVDLIKFKKDQEDLTGLCIGWFLIGFFFSIYGLLAAFVVNLIKKDDKGNERLKWAGIGALAELILGIILLLAIIAAFSRQ